jgi:hypothetical protein
MRQRSRPFIFPSRSNQRGVKRHRASSERGVAFLILMMVLTMLLISLTVSIPDVITQGQREKEEELLFRGDQYARGILLYHRQFNKYPQTVDDLLKKTNGYRFLRHPFRDPMTRSGKWRFIHANAAGVIFDSKTLTPPKPKKPLEGGSSGDTQSSQEAGGQGQGQENSEGRSRFSGGSNLSPESQPGSGSGDNEVKGAFIVGVASTSTRKSIRIWNNKDRYDLWEFLGVATAAVPGSQSPSGTTPNPGQQGTPGNTR